MNQVREKGFTLLEILVALFLLSVVLLATSNMVYSVIKAASQSKEKSMAVVFAQDKMEFLKNTGFSSISVGSDSPSYGGITYSRVWSVTTSGNVKIISLTVSWTDRVSRSLTLTTMRGL